jgi:hypothetical protein
MVRLRQVKHTRTHTHIHIHIHTTTCAFWPHLCSLTIMPLSLSLSICAGADAAGPLAQEVVGTSARLAAAYSVLLRTAEKVWRRGERQRERERERWGCMCARACACLC